MVDIEDKTSVATHQNNNQESSLEIGPDGIKVSDQLEDDMSGNFVTSEVQNGVGRNTQHSFGTNATQMTFRDVKNEAAILTDSEEGQQQIQITDDDDQTNEKADLKLPEKKKLLSLSKNKLATKKVAVQQNVTSPKGQKTPKVTALASRHAKAGDANRKAVIEHFMEDRAPEI